ncbi:DUF418 domain-containing protein [Domibacillus epiphyticus]
MRGFSLLGILLANLLIFQYGIWGKDEIHIYSLSGVDLMAYKFVKVAIEGSAMPIFTFLFGYSMVKMMESLKRNGVKARRHFARRFLLLLILGLLHSFLLWEGDILSFYGVMGFFLLLFLKRSKKALLIWGTILLVLSFALGYGVVEETPAEKEKMSNYVEATKTIYANGTYTEIMEQRNNEDPLIMPDYVYLILLLLSPFVTASLFLYGMYAAKSGLFTQPDKEKRMYQKGVLLVPLGLLLKSAAVLMPETDWTGVSGIIGASLLSVGYIFAFSLLYTWLPASKITTSFVQVGKMSLTNYLMQTVICTFVFYGYGLGLFGQLGVLNAIVFGIVIFLLQCMCSSWYMKRFRRGPIEQVLRMWTNWSWNGQIRMKEPESFDRVEGL